MKKTGAVRCADGIPPPRLSHGRGGRGTSSTCRGYSSEDSRHKTQVCGADQAGQQEGRPAAVQLWASLGLLCVDLALSKTRDLGQRPVTDKKMVTLCSGL